MAHYRAGQLECFSTLSVSIINWCSAVSGSTGRGYRWKTCEGNSSSTYLGRLVKWMETTIHFQQKIRWILPDLWVKSFCLGLLPSASSHKEAAGSCGEGKEASAQYTRSTVAIWCVLSVLNHFIIFFSFKCGNIKRVCSTYSRVSSFYITFSLGFLSHVYLFLFLAVFTQEYRPSENKLILMPFLGKIKVLQENHFW